MIFDDTYSDTVSLSKILDCFLEDEEKPSVILNFLSKYNEEEVHDIFLHSYCIPRMLCLGFVYKCSEEEYEKVLSYLKCNAKNSSDFSMYRMFMYFLWQILKSRLSDTRKNKARNTLDNILKSTRNGYFFYDKHPHRGSIGRRMAEYDSLFIEHPEEENRVIEALGRMDDGDFIDYVENVWNSLWAMRILQLDVFESLSISKQYILLTRAFSHRNSNRQFCYDILRFYRQIMNSKIEVQVKIALHDIVSNMNLSFEYLSNCSEESYDMLEKRNNLEEMIMNMQLFGIDRYAEDMIMFFLLGNNRKSLIWIYENCKEILEESIDVTDMISKWIEDGDSNG